MTDPDGIDRTDTSRLAAASLAAGDPTGWFEALYVEARAGTAHIPWDHDTPNPLLVDWFAAAPVPQGRAMVVGCGPGRDAEFVASLGFATTAFDVSPTAIDEARLRHPGSAVEYRVDDLLALPAEWTRPFDLVVESHNVQALPPDLHARAAASVAPLVAPGGVLRVFGFVPADDRPAADRPAGPPWPLTRDEIGAFGVYGLSETSVEQVPDATGVGWRWRAEFRRAP